MGDILESATVNNASPTHMAKAAKKSRGPTWKGIRNKINILSMLLLLCPHLLLLDDDAAYQHRDKLAALEDDLCGVIQVAQT